MHVSIYVHICMRGDLEQHNNSKDWDMYTYKK